uniref:RagB/SusD family nutrient uptake outer membrane protein n=1 Tax=uncultured Draconibacterium sp. TaxID=1573823 RepID=UPI003217B8CC
MKKVLLYLILIGSSVVFTGCDDLLEKDPIHELNASTFFSNENDLKIYSYSFYKFGLPTANTIAKTDGTSDYAAINNPSDFIAGVWSSEDQNGWSVSDWNDLKNINYFLENIKDTPVDESVLKHYEGLARFWRAFFYLQKVQTFGDVPWYDKALDRDDEDLYKGRDSREYVMGKVLEDISFAAENMREVKDGFSSLVNRYTALALKSRICLYEGTYRRYHAELGLNDSDAWLREAANAARELIDSGKYNLLNTGNPAKDYRTLFTSENLSGIGAITGEVILALNMDTDSREWHDLTWNFNSPTNGSRWSLIKPFVNTYLMRDGSRFTDKSNYDEIEFVSEMRNRDYRLSQTIRTEGYKRADGVIAPPDFAVTLTGYHIMKWSLDDAWHDGQGQCTNSIPVFRYAEVLLNYAEAKAELGEFGTAEWNETIKPLRERAGVLGVEPATADNYLQSTFFAGINDKYLLEIRRERGIELCFEGLRYQDLMRWKLGELLDSETLKWQGIYIPELGVNYDLNGDAIPDFSVVESMPSSPTAGVKYVVLGANITRTASGHLEWAYNVNRKWEDKKYLRPIPKDATLLNPNLLPQNLGWE